MRIDCPSCNAGYDVPPERLTAGRIVKCARCGDSWTPVAVPVPMEAAAVAAVAEPGPERVVEAVVHAPVRVAVVRAPDAPVPDAAAPPVERRRRGRVPLVAAWVVSVAVLAAVGWAAVDRRAAIMQAWPPSIRAYALVGLVR